jgi:hypothetical protein
VLIVLSLTYDWIPADLESLAVYAFAIGAAIALFLTVYHLVRAVGKAARRPHTSDRILPLSEIRPFLVNSCCPPGE